MPRGYGEGGYGVGSYGYGDLDGGGEDGEDEADTSIGFGEAPFGTKPFGGTTIDDGGGEEDGEGDEEDLLPETAYFGGGKWGQGLWDFSNEQMDAVRTAWDSGGIYMHPESNVWGLERSITQPLAFISDDCVEITKAHHIDEAVDGELDNMGALQAVHRHTGEEDPAYRLRIKAAFRASISTTTHEDVLEFITTVLQVPGERIGIDWLPSVPGTAQVSVYETDLENALISAEQLATYATQVVPAGHKIIIQIRGTFRFSGPNYDAQPDEGFSDADFEGGTFSQAITE
jgi:hypothetical protein